MATNHKLVKIGQILFRSFFLILFISIYFLYYLPICPFQVAATAVVVSLSFFLLLILWRCGLKCRGGAAVASSLFLSPLAPIACCIFALPFVCDYSLFKYEGSSSSSSAWITSKNLRFFADVCVGQKGRKKVGFWKETWRLCTSSHKEVSFIRRRKRMAPYD